MQQCCRQGPRHAAMLPAGSSPPKACSNGGSPWPRMQPWRARRCSGPSMSSLDWTAGPAPVGPAWRIRLHSPPTAHPNSQTALLDRGRDRAQQPWRLRPPSPPQRHSHLPPPTWGTACAVTRLGLTTLSGMPASLPRTTSRALGHLPGLRRNDSWLHSEWTI
jgi:hypothetical protein